MNAQINFLLIYKNEFSEKVGESLNMYKDKSNLNEALNVRYFRSKDKSTIDELKILKTFACKLYIEKPDPA